MAFKVARHGDPCWSVDWFSWLVEAFSGKVLPSSCPFSWILVHFLSVASIAAGPQGRDQECAWEPVVVAGGHQWCLSQGAGTKRVVSPEPAVALSSLCPRFPACLEVLCCIWVNQWMLSDVLATGELLGSAGELLQGQELPRLSLLPSTAMERAPEAAPRRLPSPSAGRDPPEALSLPGQH